MANHVHSAIRFERLNEKAKEKLQEMFSRLREDNDRQWLSDIFVDGKELTYEESEKYSWTTEFIGPKWCYLEDWNVEDDVPYFATTSAWSAPVEGLENIIKILNEFDDNIVATIVYEDEMPNFVGWDIYYSDGEIGSADVCSLGGELEHHEIVELAIQEYPEIAKGWDADDNEWKDDEDGEEASELFYDVLWELSSDWQHSELDDALQDFLNEN